MQTSTHELTFLTLLNKTPSSSGCRGITPTTGGLSSNTCARFHVSESLFSESGAYLVATNAIQIAGDGRSLQLQLFSAGKSKETFYPRVRAFAYIVLKAHAP